MEASFNIVEVFIAAAQKNPDSCALIHDDRQITYRALLDEVKATALYFLSKGIRDNHKVLVFVPMSIDLYRVVLALFYIGASPVFLDSWTSIKRLQDCCQVVPCQAVIAPIKFLWLALFIKPLRHIPIKLSTNFRQSAPGASLPFATKPAQTALVTFTTGSTGIPKAADRTHAYLKAQLNALTPLIPEDATVLFSTLPIVVLINLALGKTTVLPPRKYKMKKPATATFIASAAQQKHVDTLIVSPSVAEQLIAFKLPKLRYIITGGGPVFPIVAAQLMHQFPQAKTTVIFGSTEAEPISHIEATSLQDASPDLLSEYGLPVGFPDRHTTVAILPFNDEKEFTDYAAGDWKNIILPPGQAGEIVVSGHHVLEHYLNNPAAEAFHKIKVAGRIWHRTGDAGRLDDAGRLYFLGRCNEVIDRPQGRIFPAITMYRFCTMTATSAAALLEIKGQLTLVVEADQPLPPAPLSNALNACCITEARLVYLKKIPKDPRHQTKIDYEQLRKIMG